MQGSLQGLQGSFKGYMGSFEGIFGALLSVYWALLKENISHLREYEIFLSSMRRADTIMLKLELVARACAPKGWCVCTMRFSFEGI